MASNATPTAVKDLIPSGEDLCKGIKDFGVAVNLKQNTFTPARAELDALIATEGNFTGAEGEEPAAYTALHSADDVGSKFISTAVKVLSITLGNSWSDVWLATGLPDNCVGLPRTQDSRYAALGGLNTYFTSHPDMEVNTPRIIVTAVLAKSCYDTITATRGGVKDATKKTADKKILRDAAMETFRQRYSGTVSELGQLLGVDDPRWYEFGLSRPGDPAQPEVPAKVHATVLGAGRVLVKTSGAIRASSFDFYRKIIGTDTDPVKMANTPGLEYTFEGLPVGAKVEVTVTGVNDAGEGHACAPVTVTVT